MSHIRNLASAFAALAVAALLPAPLAAQGDPPATIVQVTAPLAAPAPAATDRPTADRAPLPELTLPQTRAGTAVGLRALEAAALPVPAPVPAFTARNTSMMIVGGVAIVIGSVVGGGTGNVLMIGGAVVGLVGLWRYLQ